MKNFSLNVNGIQLDCLISLWIADDNRITEEQSKRPNSMMWSFASQVSICHQNFCRKQKLPPSMTTEEICNYVDEIEPQEILRVSNLIAEEIKNLNASFVTPSTGNQPATEEKKMDGEIPAALSSVS